MRQPGDSNTGHILTSAPARASRTSPLRGQRPQTSRVTPRPSSHDSYSRLPLDAGRRPGTGARASSPVFPPNSHYPTLQVGRRTPGGLRNLSKATQLQGTEARIDQAHHTLNSGVVSSLPGTGIVCGMQRGAGTQPGTGSPSMAHVHLCWDRLLLHRDL